MGIKKFQTLFLLTIILFFFCFALARQYCKLTERWEATDCKIGASHFFQEWYFKNCNDPHPPLGVRYLEGRLLKIKYNNDDPIIDDHDLNMYIQPFPAYEWMAVNSEGTVNPEDGEIPSGAIEAEVRTIESLIHEFFPSGRVRVAGWHVEDTGHTCWDPKTEIHPIKWMIGDQETSGSIGSGSNFSVLFAQDISGRFETSGQSLSADFNFDVNPRSSIVRPDLDEQGGVASVGVLSEEAILDGHYGHQESSYSSNADESTSQVCTSITLYEPKSSHYSSEPDYIPIYLGRFARGSEDSYQDSVVYNIEQISAETKRIVLNVTAELQGVGESRWTYEEGGAESAEIATKTQYITGSNAHRIQFDGRYCPALDETRTSWSVRVGASDLPSSYGLSTADRPMVRRRYFLKERIFRIEPSWLRIGKQERKPQLVDVQPGRDRDFFPGWEGAVACDLKRELWADYRLLPQINWRGGTYSWFVLFGEERIEVTEEAPYQGDGFVVSIDPSDHSHLLIDVTRPQDPNVLFYEFDVEVAGTTELGEELSSSVPIRTGCLPGSDFTEFFDNIAKAELVAQKLREWGLLERFWGRVTGRLYTLDFVPLGEPYKVIPRLEGRSRAAMEAFYKLLDTGTVTRSEMEDLRWMAELGAKARWREAPPKNAFDAFVVGGSLDSIRRSRFENFKRTEVLPVRERVNIRFK